MPISWYLQIDRYQDMILLMNRSKKRTKKRLEKVKVYSHEFFLTPGDRLTYIYKRDDIKDIIEVVNVSYELEFEDTWITIIHYDSHHGYLHVHKRLSIEDENEIVVPLNIPGFHDSWLKWAITDIKDNYIMYRSNFLQRL